VQFYWFKGSSYFDIILWRRQVATKPNDGKFLSKTPQKVLEVSNFVAWYQRNLERAQNFFDIQRFNY
jgi:hypothetical protein